MRNSFLFIAALCLLFVVPIGCGSSAGTDCEDQATQTCVCPGGLISTQTCVDGAWGECDCEGVGGDSDSDSDADMVENVPQVVVGATPSSGIAPLDVGFHATVANGDGSLTFAWNFGDGDTDTSGPDPSHQFTAGGMYNVVLVVTDEDGDEGMGNVHIHVLDSTELGVEITPTPQAGEAPLSVDFKATPIGGNPPYTYEWDFNADGTIDAMISEPSYVFTTAGIHEVTVTATDGAGQEAEDSVNIYVAQPNQMPEVSAQVIANACNPRPNDPDYAVQLDGTQSMDTDGQITYEWRFVTVPMPEEDDDDDFVPDDDDDDNDNDDNDDNDNDDFGDLAFLPSAHVANPRFIPPINGTYQVQLFVSDGEYTVGSEILTIEVSDEPDSIEALEGADQTAEVDNDYWDPFAALVTNHCGAPIPDALVRGHGYNAWVDDWMGDSEGQFAWTNDNGEVWFWGRSGIKAGEAQLRVTTGCHTASWDLAVTAGPPEKLIMDMFNSKPRVTDEAGSGGVLNFEVTDYWLNPVAVKAQFGLSLDVWQEEEESVCEDNTDSLFCFTDAIPDGQEDPFEEEDCKYLPNIVTDDDGTASVEVLSKVDYQFRVWFDDAARIIEGDYIGQLLDTYGRKKWSDDFESDKHWEAEHEWSQWERGAPASGVGPAAAHSGTGLLGTNLDGDYLVGYGEDDDDDDDDDHVYLRDRIVQNFNIAHGNPRAIIVEMWQWYDMMGDTCPECAAANGFVRRTPPSGWGGILYPVGDYPGPGPCNESGDENMEHWGYGGTSLGEWEPAMIYWESGDGGGGNIKLALEFLTATYGEADGAGWYVDDLQVSLLYQYRNEYPYRGYADIQFAAGPPAFADSWMEMPGYPILDEPDGGIEDCNELGVNAVVATCVYDEFENAIQEEGVVVDYSFEDDYEAPNRTDNTARFVETLVGTLNSGAGSTVAEAETSEDGLIMIAISDTEPETVLVYSSADGLTDTDSTEVYFSEQGSFPEGDCCENPMPLTGEGTSFSVYLSDTCSYHPLDQFLECGNGLSRDIVFTFEPDQDDLFTISHSGNGGDTIAELRDITDGCPGTLIPNEGNPDEGNCIESSMYAYLYENRTYALVVQYKDDPCPMARAEVLAENYYLNVAVYADSSGS